MVANKSTSMFIDSLTSCSSTISPDEPKFSSDSFTLLRFADEMKTTSRVGAFKQYIVGRSSEATFADAFEKQYNSRSVAVKVIQPNMACFISSERKENFQREVTLLSKVKHENIVKHLCSQLDQFSSRVSFV